VGRIKDLVLNIGANTKQLNKELGKTRSKFRRTFGEIQNMGKGLSVGVSAPLAAFGAMASKTFVDFEFQMAKVKAVSGATTSEFKALESQAKELGRTTMFTASEVAGLQLSLSRLGFTSTEIQGATADILNLAQAADADLSHAADVTASTLRAFGLDVSQTGHLADVMASSFSGSALSMDSFSNAMQYVAPVSKAAGVSLEETTAMLAVLANNGIRGSKAGRALRRILGEMAKTGKPAKEAIQDLAAEGLTLSDAFDEVGRSAQTQLLILAENTDKLDPLTERFENANGAAAEMAATMDATTHGALKRMQSAVEGAQLAVGSALAPALTKLAQIVGDVAGYFARLNPTTQGTAVVMGTLAAAAGPLLVMLPSLAQGIRMVAMSTRFLAGPIGILTLSLTALLPLFTDFSLKAQDVVKDVDKVTQSVGEMSEAQLATEAGLKNLTGTIDERLAKTAENSKWITEGIAAERKELEALTAKMEENTAAGRESSFTDKKRADALREYLKPFDDMIEANDELIKRLQERKKAEEEAADAKDNAESLEEFKARAKKESEHAALMRAHEEEFIKQLREEEKARAAVNAETPGLGKAVAIDTSGLQDVSIDPEEELDEMTPSLEKLGQTLVANRERAKAFGEALNGAIREGAAAMAENMGSMLGSVAAGTASVRDLANTFLTGLADLAIKIGQIAISTGAAILGIKKALESLNPAVAIAAGVALVALGSFVKSSLAKSAEEVPALASGGLAFGPTLAMVGDNRGAMTDPEVIAPLSKLQNMMGGQSVNVTGRISGRDLVLIQERGQNTRRRQTGIR